MSALIELVGSDTRRLLDEEYPERSPNDDTAENIIAAPVSGVVTSTAPTSSYALSRRRGLRPRDGSAAGSVRSRGCTAIPVTGDLDRVAVDRVVGAIRLGLERTLEHDVAYGMRMLVDMAERSLAESPFTDPTTAVQAIDRLHDCLRQLAVRILPDGVYRDEAGNVRLIVPVMDWDAYVHLAFDEIRLAGARSPQVTRRLTAALADLETVVPPDRLPALRYQQASLVSAVSDAVPDSDDAAFALVADRLGIGVKASTNALAPELSNNGATRASEKH